MTLREVELENLLKECRAELAASRRETELLRQKMDSLLRHIFSRSSEQIDPAQLELLLQLSEMPATVPQETVPENSVKRLLRWFGRRRKRESTRSGYLVGSQGTQPGGRSILPAAKQQIHAVGTFSRRRKDKTAWSENFSRGQRGNPRGFILFPAVKLVNRALRVLGSQRKR